MIKNYNNCTNYSSETHDNNWINNYSNETIKYDLKTVKTFAPKAIDTVKVANVFNKETKRIVYKVI